MASFTPVSTGNATNATDINQLINALNGTTGSQVTILSTSSTANALTLKQSAAPSGSDAWGLQFLVSGDTSARCAAYIRAADGYGGFFAGTGSGITATMYAQSGGWTIPQSLTVNTNLTVGSSISTSGFYSSNYITFPYVVSPTDSNDFIGFNSKGSTDGGVFIFDHAGVLCAGSGWWCKQNNYFNGTSDIFINGSGVAIQLSSNLGGTGLGYRQSSNTPAAGGTITWGTTYNIPQMGGGGGHIYVQSSAPSSPVTGDLWVDTSTALS